MTEKISPHTLCEIERVAEKLFVASLISVDDNVRVAAPQTCYEVAAAFVEYTNKWKELNYPAFTVDAGALSEEELESIRNCPTT